jgi:hypothetical protein
MSIVSSSFSGHEQNRPLYIYTIYTFNSTFLIINGAGLLALPIRPAIAAIGFANTPQ